MGIDRLKLSGIIPAVREFLLVSYWNKKEKLKEANLNQRVKLRARLLRLQAHKTKWD